jgi:hypothetical protein
MRFTNVAQATAAGVELARRLHAMLEEGNDGSGGVDLLRVSALNGDATQRQEEFDRLSAELQEIWDERTRLETMQATFERTRQIVDDGTTPRNRPAQPRGRERDHRSAGSGSPKTRAGRAISLPFRPAGTCDGRRSSLARA